MQTTVKKLRYVNSIKVDFPKIMPFDIRSKINMRTYNTFLFPFGKIFLQYHQKTLPIQKYFYVRKIGDKKIQKWLFGFFRVKDFGT